MAASRMTLRACILLAAIALVRADSDEDDERFNDLSFLAYANTEAEALTALDAHFTCNVTSSPAHTRAGRAASEACSNSAAAGGGIHRDSGRDAIELCMSRGWWDASIRLIEAAGRDGVDLSAPVHASASRIRGRLQSLVEALGSSGPKSTGIQPAFEWAQSPHAIFLQVKFAHRLDAPSTLGCEAEYVQFGSRTLDMRAECREKNKAFALSLSLLRGIHADNCTWSMTSVGRASVTLVKSVQGVWPRLLHGTGKMANMHTWWAMKEKYERENDDFLRAAKANATAANLNATTARSVTPTVTPTATQAVQGTSRAVMADGAVDVTAAGAGAAAGEEPGY